MIVSREFVSIGVNRVVNSLAWGGGDGDGLIAYGGHNSVVIYDPEAAVIESTLTGHTGLVNTVLWVEGGVVPGLPAGTRLLLSGAADHTLRVWAVRDAKGGAGATEEPWRCIAVLEGHTAPVTSLACYPLNNVGPNSPPAAPSGPAGSFLVVSTAGDANVHIWHCTPSLCSSSASPTTAAAAAAAGGLEPGAEGAVASSPLLQSVAEAYGQANWALHQTLREGSHIQQAAALTHLPMEPSWLILATGGTDKLVRLYLRAPGPDTQFSEVCSLPGHDNWVRSLAFCHARVGGGASADGQAASNEVELLLASASQDRYGRIWRIRDEKMQAAAEAASEQMPGGGGDGGGGGGLAASIARYAPKPLFVAAGCRLAAALEAILIGHEDWLHSICWRPQAVAAPAATVPGPQATAAVTAAGQEGGTGAFLAEGGRDVPRDRSSLRLLTSSMDRTMMLWAHDPASGIWMSGASVGDAGAQCLGYFGGCFSPGGGSILAHGFTGALHLWGQRGGGAEGGTWEPLHAQGGHFGAVAGCCWSMDGACLLTVGEDQTARIFTTVQKPGTVPPSPPPTAASSSPPASSSPVPPLHWCELARPQVHGHDFTCVASISAPASGPDGTASPYLFISGSEEKMLRAFEAPQVFLDTLDSARGRLTTARPAAPQQQQQQRRAFGAAIPALGLSNKAVYEEANDGGNAGICSGMPGGNYAEGPDLAPCAAPSVATGPPLEEHLAQNTLWPEVHKLYGHGNDVYCLAASHDGRYVASACVAKSAATAELWFWAVGSWKGVAQVQAHTLTATGMAWSHSDDYLASCSRDRSFCITRRLRSQVTGVEDGFQLVQRIRSAHSRVLWGVAWSPDDGLVATGSRDETIKLWAVQQPGSSEVAGPAGQMAAMVSERPTATLPAFPSAVSSLAFSPSLPSDGGRGSRYLLAVGLESGELQVWSFPPSDGEGLQQGLRCCWGTDSFTRHAAAVSAVCWRRVVGAGGELQIGTAGRDHSVRVFTVIP